MSTSLARVGCGLCLALHRGELAGDVVDKGQPMKRKGGRR